MFFFIFHIPFLLLFDTNDMITVIYWRCFLTPWCPLQSKRHPFHLRWEGGRHTSSSLLISNVDKPPFWRKTLIVESYGWAFSIDVCTEQLSLSIPSLFSAGQSWNVGITKAVFLLKILAPPRFGLWPFVPWSRDLDCLATTLCFNFKLLC